MSTQEYKGVTIEKMIHSECISNKFSRILKIIIDEPLSEHLVSSWGKIILN